MHTAVFKGEQRFDRRYMPKDLLAIVSAAAEAAYGTMLVPVVPDVSAVLGTGAAPDAQAPAR